MLGSDFSEQWLFGAMTLRTNGGWVDHPQDQDAIEKMSHRRYHQMKRVLHVHFSRCRYTHCILSHSDSGRYFPQFKHTHSSFSRPTETRNKFAICRKAQATQNRCSWILLNLGATFQQVACRHFVTHSLISCLCPLHIFGLWSVAF